MYLINLVDINGKEVRKNPVGVINGPEDKALEWIRLHADTIKTETVVGGISYPFYKQEFVKEL